MPTYEYECSACGHQFEEFQKITADAISLCPECGEEKARRLISASAFHLKGSGWYKTDYAKSGSSNTANSSASSSTSSTKEAKPSTSGETKETKPAAKKTETKKADTPKKETKSSS